MVSDTKRLLQYILWIMFPSVHPSLPPSIHPSYLKSGHCGSRVFQTSFSWAALSGSTWGILGKSKTRWQTRDLISAAGLRSCQEDLQRKGLRGHNNRVPQSPHQTIQTSDLRWGLENHRNIKIFAFQIIPRPVKHQDCCWCSPSHPSCHLWTQPWDTQRASAPTILRASCFLAKNHSVRLGGAETWDHNSCQTSTRENLRTSRVCSRAQLTSRETSRSQCQTLSLPAPKVKIVKCQAGGFETVVQKPNGWA